MAHLLRGGILEQIRERNNSVIEGLPGYCSNRMVYVPEPDGGSVLVLGFVPSREPYSPGSDVWFHYSEIEHVEQWAAFIAEHLPDCVSKVRAGVS
jgi:hypothetical protein